MQSINAEGQKESFFFFNLHSKRKEKPEEERSNQSQSFQDSADYRALGN